MWSEAALGIGAAVYLAYYICWKKVVLGVMWYGWREEENMIQRQAFYAMTEHMDQMLEMHFGEERAEEIRAAGRPTVH